MDNFLQETRSYYTVIIASRQCTIQKVTNFNEITIINEQKRKLREKKVNKKVYNLLHPIKIKTHPLTAILARERVVVAEDFQMLAVARRSAIGGHHPVERLVRAPEPRQPYPHHHFSFFKCGRNLSPPTALPLYLYQSRSLCERVREFGTLKNEW